MLVDRHVARGEGEQPAGHPLSIGTGGHLAHEGAADPLSLVPRVDAEPGEMPVRLRSKRAHGAIPVTNKGLEAVHCVAAPRGPDPAPSSRVAILRRYGGMRGREPAGDPRNRGWRHPDLAVRQSDTQEHLHHPENAGDPLLCVGQKVDKEWIVDDGASHDGSRLTEALGGQTNRGNGGGHGGLLGRAYRWCGDRGRRQPRECVRDARHSPRRAGTPQEPGLRHCAGGCRGNSVSLFGYRMNRTTELASSRPMTTLKALAARSVCRSRWAVAPKASQTKQLGSATRTKRTPNESDCVSGLAASACR